MATAAFGATSCSAGGATACSRRSSTSCSSSDIRDLPGGRRCWWPHLADVLVRLRRRQAKSPARPGSDSSPRGQVPVDELLGATDVVAVELDERAAEVVGEVGNSSVATLDRVTDARVGRLRDHARDRASGGAQGAVQRRGARRVLRDVLWREVGGVLAIDADEPEDVLL